jgi:hypothetical protein
MEERDRLGAYRLGILILFDHRASTAGTSSRSSFPIRTCFPSSPIDTAISKVRS